VLPDPRLFETGLVAYALSGLAGEAASSAVKRARAWLAHGVPQTHDRLAHCLDETPRLILSGSTSTLDLSDPNFYTDVNCRKAMMLHLLALHAGLEVNAPYDEAGLYTLVSRFYQRRNRLRLKQWSRGDLLSFYLLLQSRQPVSAYLEEALRDLVALQGADGSFSHNPVSTAMALLALSAVARDSTARRRCSAYLLEQQQPDGTWRFCSSDVWDTTLMMRSFSAYPLFRNEALPGAVRFLKASRNSDGGWGYASGVESDNDTTACALLALSDGGCDTADALKSLQYLAHLQTSEGLWKTWQSTHDPAVEDTIAHVISALNLFQGFHQIPLDPARRWLADQFQQRGRWTASWYRSRPYAVLEVSQAMGRLHPFSRQALRTLEQDQNPDGGWGVEPGCESAASSTGLALAALFPFYDLDAPVIRNGLEFLFRTQRADGSWEGQLEMYGPRPLLCHLSIHTHAFASRGLMAAWCRLQRG